MPTSEESKRGGFPWGRAFRIGLITAVAIAAYELAMFVLLDGPDSEDFMIAALTGLFLAPPAIAIAAVVLRFRRDLVDGHVAIIAALVILGVGSLFGLIAYIAVHLSFPAGG